MSQNPPPISYLPDIHSLATKQTIHSFQSFSSLSKQSKTLPYNLVKMKFSAVLAVFLAAVAYAAPSNILGGGNDDNASLTHGVVMEFLANLVPVLLQAHPSVLQRQR